MLLAQIIDGAGVSSAVQYVFSNLDEALGVGTGMIWVPVAQMMVTFVAVSGFGRYMTWVFWPAEEDGCLSSDAPGRYWLRRGVSLLVTLVTLAMILISGGIADTTVPLANAVAVSVATATGCLAAHLFEPAVFARGRGTAYRHGCRVALLGCSGCGLAALIVAVQSLTT